MCGAVGALDAVGAIDSIGLFSPTLKLGRELAKHFEKSAWWANRVVPISRLGSAYTNRSSTNLILGGLGFMKAVHV